MIKRTDARNIRPGDIVLFSLGEARVVRAVDRVEAEWVEVVWEAHPPTVHRGQLHVIVHEDEDPAYVERERQRELTGGDPW